MSQPAGPGARPGDGAPLLDLQRALEPAPGAKLPAGYQLDLGRMPIGTVLRRVHERDARLVDVEVSMPSLVADYWLERPDGRGLVQLAFATPMVGLRDSLLGLFDAVTGALHWVHAKDRPVEVEAVPPVMIAQKAFGYFPGKTARLRSTERTETAESPVAVGTCGLYCTCAVPFARAQEEGSCDPCSGLAT